MTSQDQSLAFGLSSTTLATLIQVFAQWQRIDRVLIYGSRAKGCFRTGSDIDLTLIGTQLVTTDLLKIEDELDDLLLPYKIDLSLYHQLTSETLLDHISRVGKIIYERSAAKAPASQGLD